MRATLLLAIVCGAIGFPAAASDLYRSGDFPALATDRTARSVGDIVTILVYENASASNSATTASKKNSSLDGRISAGNSFDEAASFALSGNSDNKGTSGRSGTMVAQISATVDEVLPNGDVRITGEQLLNIAGEKTRIRVKGRLRVADISAANTVVSSRIADARIDYDGKGFVSRSGKPGIIPRIFNFLGLM